MSIEAKCPECGKGYRFRDEQAGKRYKCKDCGASFVIEAEELAPTKSIATSGGRKKKRKSQSPPVALYAGLGVAALVGVAAFVVFYKSRPEATAVATTPAPTAPATGPNVSVTAPATATQSGVASGSNAAPAPIAAVAATTAPQGPYDPGPPNWRLVADPAPADYDVSTFAVKPPTEALAAGAEVHTPTTASPFLLIQASKQLTVWNLLTGKETGNFQAEITSGKKALSPDGQYFARESFAGRNHHIEVFSTQDGKVLMDLVVADLKHPTATAEGRVSLRALDFAAPGQLVVAASRPKASWLEVFDVRSGKSLRTIVGPERFFDFLPFLFSPGRRYVMSAYKDNLVCVDLTTGQQAGLLPLPRAKDGYGSVQYLGFSFAPDGSRLAGLFTESSKNRLIAWDAATGQSLADIKIGSDLQFVESPTVPIERIVQWLPGKGGWMLYGHSFLHRASGKLVMMLRREDTSGFQIHYRQIVEGDRIALITGDYRNRRFQVLPLALDGIAASLAALGDKSPAQLRPGDAVSIEVDVKSVRFGTPEETKAELIGAITKRLETEGFSVGKDKPVVFYCRYDEAKGQTLYEVKGSTPFARDAAKTGRTIEATDVNCEIGWKLKERNKPLWKDQVDYKAAMHTSRGEMSDKSVRNDILRRVLSNIESHPIVYFLPDPKDKENKPLPLVISFDPPTGK